MAVDPLRLTRFADQPYYRALSGSAYDRKHPPVSWAGTAGRGMHEGS
jgi:hypothetical protein